MNFWPLFPVHHLAGEFNLVIVASHLKKMGFPPGPVRKAEEDDENVCTKCASAFPAFGKAVKHSVSHQVLDMAELQRDILISENDDKLDDIPRCHLP